MLCRNLVIPTLQWAHIGKTISVSAFFFPFFPFFPLPFAIAGRHQIRSPSFKNLKPCAWPKRRCDAVVKSALSLNEESNVPTDFCTSFNLSPAKALVNPVIINFSGFLLSKLPNISEACVPASKVGGALLSSFSSCFFSVFFLLPFFFSFFFVSFLDFLALALPFLVVAFFFFFF